MQIERRAPPQRWLVAGGGVGGSAAALWLARRGAQVVLVEASRNLGRSTPGIRWGDFHLDLGCHVFGNDSDAGTELLLELLGGEAHPVSLRPASVLDGRLSPGFEIPDLTSLGPERADAILRELIETAGRPSAPAQSLADVLQQRYGESAAAVLGDATRKMLRCDSSAVAPSAFRMMPFRRLRLVDDQAALDLKRDPQLDDRIAASPQVVPQPASRAFPARCLVPMRHGIAGFGESAARVLAERGVEVHTGCEVVSLDLESDGIVALLGNGAELDFDRVFWANGPAPLETLLLQTHRVGEHLHGVPMVLYYFSIAKDQEGPYSYVQDFDLEDLVFRHSVPGRYGRDNCPEGLSYVCCEVPADADSPVFAEPERYADRVWQEAVRCGVVRGGIPRERLVKTTPRSYRAPLRGFEAACTRLVKRLEGERRLLCPDPTCFTAGQSLAETVRLLEAEA